MNPAYIPEIMKATFTIGGRYQWTVLMGLRVPFMPMANISLWVPILQISLSFLSDDIGYQYTRQPKIGYAFMLPIGDDSYLNLGIGGRLVNRGYDASKIDPANTKNMEDSYDLQKERLQMPRWGLRFCCRILKLELLSITCWRVRKM